ncbi:MAG: TrmB family transcriptional regulator [Polyangiaceae bacterium]|jgi:sugar-specific transcriptional regulator TrmB|nr:TrmB family transcriptional regulator [Polyangiaceae bacterium]
MGEPDVVGALEALGFNRNEGRAYASLLAAGPSTGYEVSQHAGIPRSAVYAVLRKLVAEGVARRTPGPPERFLAISPESLCAQLQKRFDTSSQALREAAARISLADAAPDAHSVQGYDRILEEAAGLIHGATSTLVVSGWPRELSRLESELARAEERGVFVVVFSHAALPPTLTGVRYSYGLSETDLEAFWRHRLVVVADDRRSLLGAAERSTDDRAVVSDTAAIAEVAVSQVALDITLLCQRAGADAGAVLAKILGDRIGRLDTLRQEPSAIEAGARVAAGPKRAARSKRGPADAIR